MCKEHAIADKSEFELLSDKMAISVIVVQRALVQKRRKIRSESSRGGNAERIERCTRPFLSRFRSAPPLFEAIFKDGPVSLLY